MTSASKIWTALAAAGLVAAGTGTAHAVASYGNLATPPGFYAGNGPINGNFTIETTGGIELGLRAKDRETVLPIDGSSGIYEARTGLCMAGSGFCGSMTNKALWNYEFSVNTLGSGLDLTNYRVQLRIDIDPSGATNFVTISDAYSNWGDNEYVDGPAYAGKRVASNGNPLDDAPVAGEDGVQQSSNPLFANSGFMGGYNPWIAGLYEIELSIFAIGGITALATTDITVQVVPEPGSLAILGLGLAGLGFARRKKQS